MNLWQKIVAFGGLIGFIAILLWIIKLQHAQKEEQAKINASLIEMQKLQNEVVRSQNQYVSEKDFDQKIKDLNINLEGIQQDLQKFGAETKAIQVTKIITQTQTLTEQPSQAGQQINPNPDPINPDKFNYLQRQQLFKLHEKIGNIQIPLASVGFSGWQERPWSAQIYGRQYQLNTVLGQDEDGRHYTYSQFTIESEGKKYLVPITESKIEQKLPENKWRFYPKIMLGLAGGIAFPDLKMTGEITPNLSVSLFNFGPTKINSEWAVVNLGIGYQSINQDMTIYFSPAQYNLGYQLPLIDNLYLGPAFSVNFQGEFGFYMGIGVGL